MTQPADARPVPQPGTAAGARAFIITPFTRMARTHAGSTMADAMVAASLAGSLFFTLPAGDARAPVLRYLVITMLPFAVVSPLIGPMIDRMKGGHRLMVVGSLLVRAVLCYLMATVISGGSLLFFFYALCLLVCQKAYQVGRSALVPTVVQSADDLVQANSKLSLISGLAGFVGVVPAAILLKVFGPEWSLRLAMVTYAAAGLLALRISRVRVAEESADETERHELRGASIVMAGSAMGLIRAGVGFLTLLVAFDFRGGDRPAWQFGIVGGASVVSQLAGAAAGPRIRSITSEENLLTSVLALLVAGSVLALLLGDVTGAAVLGACVGFAAGGGKLAFDSILQRDAPDANRGRAFAKFETRFQVTWVVGALIPVAITMGVEVGFAVLLVLSVVALTSYIVARLAYAHRMGHHQSAATAAAVEIEDRFAEVSGEVKGRLASGSRAAFRRIRAGRTAAADGYDESGFPLGDADASSPADLLAEGSSEAWPEPEWADARTQRATGPVDAVEADRPRRRGRRRRGAPAPVAVPARHYDDLAAASPTAWSPPEAETEFPWEPPPEEPDPGAAYLDDVDPAVDNPFPWTPDARPGS